MIRAIDKRTNAIVIILLVLNVLIWTRQRLIPVIFSSQIKTEIKGIYYLRNTHPVHPSNAAKIGTIADLGVLSKMHPTTPNERHCSSWVQFYFDEAGFYDRKNRICNIYYHVWWMTSTKQAILGYENSGTFTSEPTEGFTVNSSNSKRIDGSYSLYAGTQVLSPSQAFAGDDIFKLSLILCSNNNYPQVVSSAEQASFVIFSLPDHIDTLGLSQDGDIDADDDGVTDYHELYVSCTNPYVADTDNDGLNDGFEIDNKMNPLDSQRAPVFNSWSLAYDGTAEGDYLGDSIAAISDIDGDGKDDVLISAPLADPDGLSGAGTVFLYSSGTAKLLQQYNGGEANIHLGDTVCSISDLDDDGKEDVLVSAPLASPNNVPAAGSVFIFSSVTGHLLRQFDGQESLAGFGHALATISDIDGDGKEDVLIGVSNASPSGLSGAGAAYIYSSSAGNLIQQFHGKEAKNSCGSAISSIPDLDEDGKADVLIGAYNASPGGLQSAGSVYICSSGTGKIIRQFNGKAVNDYLGFSVASISDIDGDNLPDVLAGAPYANPNGFNSAGSVYIFSSATGEIIKQFDGENNDIYLGDTLAYIADIDEDGMDDILVGAHYASPEHLYRAGSIYIFSSGSGNLIRKYNGKSAGDYFGSAIATISDLDGDRKDDVLVGAYFASPMGISWAGSAYIYSSYTGIQNQSWKCETNQENILNLDHYFAAPHNTIFPELNDKVKYTASTIDNEFIDVFISEKNLVTFYQPHDWSGTESVVFTATDSTGLSTASNTVSLTVIQ